MLDTTRQALTEQTADKVLTLSKSKRIPPTPIVFEVLTHYYSGAEPALTEAVEAALARPEDVREESIGLIYDEWLGPEAVHKGLSRVRDGLTSEIADMSVQLTDSLKGNLQLAALMRESIRDLAGHATKEDVKSICKSISASNRQHLTSTQNMALQLERTQHQLSEMQKELTVLRRNASTDHLTGLPNRRYLDEKLEHLIQGGARFCFAMIDLDHFKQVNDTWGHSAGDNILRRLGQLLQDNTKGKDIPCRVGGEEFALILPETDLSGAKRLCEHISAMFCEINWISQSTEEEIGALTLSGGVTVLAPTDSATTLYERADMLLYEAKSNGRNQIVAG